MFTARPLYVPAFNIHAVTSDARARIHPGQWVRAGNGPDAPLGQYLGQSKAGSDVCAWVHNRRRYDAEHGRGAYVRNLRTYVKATQR